MKKKEMISLTAKSKKNVIHAKKDSVLLMMIKKSIIKLKIIDTTQENKEELLKVFVI